MINYLLKRYKQIAVIPLTVITNTLGEYGGIYYHPESKEILINDKYYSLSNGLILVNSGTDERCINNCIAHEFKHHIQFCNGIEYDGIDSKKFITLNYKQRIINYIIGSKSETDAFLFAEKIMPCSHTAQWRDWLKLTKTKLRNYKL